MNGVRGAEAYLHHIALCSPQPDRLADFYCRSLKLDRETQGSYIVCRNGDRRILFTQGSPKTLGYAAFACQPDKFPTLRDDLAKVTDIVPFASGLLQDGAFAVRDPDGNRTVFGIAIPDSGPTRGLRAPIQHLTLASTDLAALEAFYCDKLGFLLSDRVINDAGKITATFMRSNREHHTMACFLTDQSGIDHHSYEAGEWNGIRDWADALSELKIALIWGPGRHGPGNNLFIFIEDPDRNRIEISAELEMINSRPAREWPHEPRTINLWGTAMMRS